MVQGHNEGKWTMQALWKLCCVGMIKSCQRAGCLHCGVSSVDIDLGIAVE